MKIIKAGISVALTIAAVWITGLTQSFGQTNIVFTGVSSTVEQAILLHWTSQSNHIYQIQYANALATNSDGSTAWQVLYDQYPSQGTNTYIGDYGNYYGVPAVPHPKYSPMRYYQILDEGTNAVPSPSVEIVSQTNGAVETGQFTVLVTASSSQPVLTTSLYVDGQQMYESDDGSNYVLNSCEWPNGPHIIFATATARSGMSGPSGVYPIYTGYGVSAPVSVVFSNLISQVAFSQQFFQPSLGQTQQVTASFAANCDWTLQIQDVNSNTVLNASGSGDSMVFNWDGTGNGETNIPDGVYTYLISAETNGAAPEIVGSGSVGSGGGSPPSPEFASRSSSELWAVAPDSETAVPFILYPPGFDTNSLTIFSASSAEVSELNSSSMGETLPTPDASPAYSGPSGQTTTAPTRADIAPAKNAAGTYAIAYYSWPSPQTVSIPQNYVEGVCHLDGSTANGVTFNNLPECEKMAINMEKAMTQHSWQLAFELNDQNLPVVALRRFDQGYSGSAIFTLATIGLFVDHGDYGTDPDYNPGSSGSKQTYFRSDRDSGDNGWLRMCQFGFGGNLKWMGILACSSLMNYSSMANAGAIPLSTTHLVCGASTVAAVGEDIGAYWTKNMFGRFLHTPETIANAWFDAGRAQYSNTTNLTGTITFRVAGYPECISDTIQNNTAPSMPSLAPGNLTKVDSQVFP